MAGEAKSYSERLFRFPRIGELDPDTDARDALVLPARAHGIEFEPGAVDYVVAYTEGYPYFIQEYGKFLWDEALTSPIARDDAARVKPLVEVVVHDDAEGIPGAFAVNYSEFPNSCSRIQTGSSRRGSGARTGSKWNSQSTPDILNVLSKNTQNYE